MLQDDVVSSAIVKRAVAVECAIIFTDDQAGCCRYDMNLVIVHHIPRERIGININALMIIAIA